MLPQPRNGLFSGSSKSLIPNVLTQKPNTVKKKALLSSHMKKLKPVSASTAECSDDSDDDVQNDFFSFNKPVDLPEHVELPLDLPTVEEPMEPKMSKLESYFKKDVVENLVELHPDEDNRSEYAKSKAGSSYSTSVEAESTNNTEMVLDDEAVSIVNFVVNCLLFWFSRSSELFIFFVKSQLLSVGLDAFLYFLICLMLSSTCFMSSKN